MKSLFERCYQVYGSLSAKFELLSAGAEEFAAGVLRWSPHDSA